jgi:hypothetical protein
LKPQASTASEILISRLNWKTVVSIGILAGIVLSSGCGFLYLLISQDSVSVKNGQMNFSKSVNTTTIAETTNPSVQGDKNAVANNNGIANSGANSEFARNSEQSFNRKDSPSIVGDNNNITIVANRDLPGFDEKSYLSAPPSDLSRYSQISDFQPDSLIPSASDTGKIQFKKEEIVILGKPYTSFFDIGFYANESRFVFKLDGTQKAALLQFGLPDLKAGSTTNGLYTVKISADGKPLWAGECRRSQGNQIISVPLDVAEKKTLTIEVTSNEKNESALFFTEAKILND